MIIICQFNLLVLLFSFLPFFLHLKYYSADDNFLIDYLTPLIKYQKFIPSAIDSDGISTLLKQRDPILLAYIWATFIGKLYTLMPRRGDMCLESLSDSRCDLPPSSVVHTL